MYRLVAGLLAAVFLSGTAFAQSATIITYAGPPLPVNGSRAQTQVIGTPNSIISDGAGGFYFTSSDQNRLYRAAADGSMTVIAGSPFGLSGYSGDGGSAVAAELAGPTGIALDNAGNFYIADTLNHRIRKVTASGLITTIAGTGTQGFKGEGTPASSAQLNTPSGVAVDSAGNVYIADQLNNRVRQITVDGTINTVAGNGAQQYSGDGGPASVASLSRPVGLAIDAAGNLYIADQFNNRIRKVGLDGVITTFAGGGSQNADDLAATGVTLNHPAGIAFDPNGNLYISESAGHRIRRVGTDGVITTFAGTGIRGFNGDGAMPTRAQLNSPLGIAVDQGGNVYIADSANNRIRRVVPVVDAISTLAGRDATGFSGDNGPATKSLLNTPVAVALDGGGNAYVSDWKNQALRKIDSSGVITTIMCCGTSATGTLPHPWGLAVDGAGNIYFADTANNKVLKIPAGFTCDDRTVRLSCKDKSIVTVAGTGAAGFKGDSGPATAAQLNNPAGLFLDSAGNLYIADYFNNRIRKVRPDGLIFTVAGQGSQGFSGDGVPATAAQLSRPSAVVLDPVGNLYIADSGNYRVRVVTPDGIIHTVAGAARPQLTGPVGDGQPATAASVQIDPADIAIDALRNLYIADRMHNRIRKVGTDGIIRTVAGVGEAGFVGDGGPPNRAELNVPGGVAVNAFGDVYISDSGNDRVRKIAAQTLFVISPLGGASVSTASSTPAIAGSARIEPAAGSATPSGLEILDYRRGDLLVSETALSAVTPIATGRAYFEMNDRFKTAIAIANPNSQDVNVTFHFDGSDVTSDVQATLAANGQLSAFFDHAPFFIPATATGTITFTASLPVAVAVLRAFINERGDSLFVPLPIFNSTFGASSDAFTLPLFADGGGWSTEIVMANPKDTAIQGTVQFLDQTGKPVPVTIGDQVSDTFPYSIDPGGATKLSTSGMQSSPQIGSVLIMPAQSFAPLGAGIISFQNGTVTLSQAVMNPNVGFAFEVYAEVSGDFDHGAPGSLQTAISISNLSKKDGKVSVELIRMDGSSTGLTDSLALPANGQVLNFLSRISGFAPLPLPFRGILRITTTLPITVAALRSHYNEQGELLFTAIPALSDSQAGVTFFPHFAQGGGFTAQFLLLNPSAVQPASGVLRLLSQSGQPVAVPAQ